MDPSVSVSESPSRLSQAVLVLVRGMRLAIVLLMVLVCWDTLATFDGLFHPKIHDRVLQPSMPSPPAATPIESLMTLPNSGGWTFADGEWDISVLNQLERGSERGDEATDDSPNSAAVAMSAEESAPLLDALAGAGASKEFRNDVNAWRLELPGLEVRARSRAIEGQERIVDIAYSIPGQYESLTLRARPVTAGSRNRREAILPLPREVRSLASRTGGDDLALASIHEFKGDWTDLEAYWISKGWVVEQTPWSAENLPSVMCRKGMTRAHAWGREMQGRDSQAEGESLDVRPEDVTSGTEHPVWILMIVKESNDSSHREPEVGT